MVSISSEEIEEGTCLWQGAVVPDVPLVRETVLDKSRVTVECVLVDRVQALGP
jgi:hypothetical protein